MCLAVPMQVLRVDGSEARCAARGVECRVSTFMLEGDEPIAVGDWLLVHAGFAIQRVDEQEARQTWELVDQVRDAQTGVTGVASPGAATYGVAGA